MGKIRAFLAIDNSVIVKEKLYEYQSSLREIRSDVKWESKDKFHITLKFLGEIDESKLSEIIETLKVDLKNFGSLKMTYLEFGYFPNFKFPRVIWFGAKSENDKIMDLNQIVETTCNMYGFEKEKNKFHPHITLGRIKGNIGIDLIKLHIKENKFENIPDIANEIIAFKSTLLKSGSVYSIVDKISLT